MKKNSTGVYTAKKKDNSIYYRASLTYKGKHISLGSFDREEAAHRCYLLARDILEKKRTHIEDYPGETIMPYDKWIILHNLRDNGIYFPTPIYLRPSFFLYYLSKDCILKFDKDDLFYYSSHKIMSRGKHLFVSDYGMQVNILNRYGIMNYAVPGRDYHFINKDEHDFRYANINIVNRYHGVSMQPGLQRPTYITRIHIKGNIKVGTYLSEAEAAIAYNKAIDLLHKNGIRKQYTPNFVEDISPKEYAEIYSVLEINPRIANYKL
ncbi:MAG: hypothetical protein IJ397_01835 [Lachnospiraceae bacterium]|nr:hypothetical protein [Lachnospiraceae bacterium]